jgi:ferredoxin
VDLDAFDLGGRMSCSQAWHTLSIVTLRIEIERDLCMGSGNCQFWAPDVFRVEDDGVAVVLDPTGAPADRIVSAAEGCPTGAITLERS